MLYLTYRSKRLFLCRRVCFNIVTCCLQTKYVLGSRQGSSFLYENFFILECVCPLLSKPYPDPQTYSPCIKKSSCNNSHLVYQYQFQYLRKLLKSVSSLTFIREKKMCNTRLIKFCNNSLFQLNTLVFITYSHFLLFFS